VRSPVEQGYAALPALLGARAALGWKGLWAGSPSQRRAQGFVPPGDPSQHSRRSRSGLGGICEETSFKPSEEGGQGSSLSPGGTDCLTAAWTEPPSLARTGRLCRPALVRRPAMGRREGWQPCRTLEKPQGRRGARDGKDGAAHRITESQNDRGWKGPLWVTQSNPLPKQGHPQQAAEDHVQVGLEYLQRRRLHSPSGQPGPGLHHPQREEVLPPVQTELLTALGFQGWVLNANL